MNDCKYCFGAGCAYCEEDTQTAYNKAAEEGGLPFAELSINQKRALSEGLSALEAMADIWSAEIRLSEMAQRIADAQAEQRPGTITAMIEQAFIEGAYRHFLDHKDAADRASRQVANKAEVDLSRVQKYTPFIAYGGAFCHDRADMEHDAGGEYVKLSDVKALLTNHNTDKADVEPIQPQSVRDERKAFDVYWGSLSGEDATEAELEVAEHAAWWAWQARPRHCLALPLSAYPKGTTYATHPATTGASTAPVNSVALNLEAQLRTVVRQRDRQSVGASTVLTDERIWEIWKSGPELREASVQQMIVNHTRAVLREVAAQAGQVAVPGWISTDDRLPDNGKDVIILYWPYDNHENERVAGTAHHVEGTFYDEDGNDMHPPSHWMLPHRQQRNRNEQSN